MLVKVWRSRGVFGFLCPVPPSPARAHAGRYHFEGCPRWWPHPHPADLKYPSRRFHDVAQASKHAAANCHTTWKQRVARCWAVELYFDLDHG